MVERPGRVDVSRETGGSRTSGTAGSRCTHGMVHTRSPAQPAGLSGGAPTPDGWFHVKRAQAPVRSGSGRARSPFHVKP